MRQWKGAGPRALTADGPSRSCGTPAFPTCTQASPAHPPDGAAHNASTTSPAGSMPSHWTCVCSRHCAACAQQASRGCCRRGARRGPGQRQHEQSSRRAGRTRRGDQPAPELRCNRPWRAREGLARQRQRSQVCVAVVAYKTGDHRNAAERVRHNIWTGPGLELGAWNRPHLHHARGCCRSNSTALVPCASALLNTHSSNGPCWRSPRSQPARALCLHLEGAGGAVGSRGGGARQSGRRCRPFEGDLQCACCCLFPRRCGRQCDWEARGSGWHASALLGAAWQRPTRYGIIWCTP